MYLNNYLKDSINLQFYKALSWTFIGNLLSKISIFIAAIFITRFVGTEIYGEIGIIQSTTSMFGVIASAGMALTATKYISQYKYTSQEKTSEIVTLVLVISFFSSIVISLIMFVFSGWLAVETLNAPHLKKFIKISSFSMFFLTISTSFAGVLSGFENFKRISLNNIIFGFVSACSMVILTYKWGLLGTTISILFASILIAILNFSSTLKELAHRKISPYNSNFLKSIRIIKTFSIPAMLNSIMVLPVMWASNSLLVNVNNGYTEMGYLNAARQWQIIIMFIPAIVSTVLVPTLSRERDFKILELSQKFLMLLIIPFSILVTIFSPTIVSMYGSEFSDSYLTLSFIVASYSISGIGSPTGSLLASEGKMWVSFIFNIIWAACLLIFTFLFKDRYGALGISVAFFLSYMVQTLIGYTYFFKKLPKSMFYRVIASILLISLTLIIRNFIL